MAKGDKQDVTKAKAAVSAKKTRLGKTQRKAINRAGNMLDREVNNAVKRGATKYSAGPLKDGARKPSVASKLNAVNKMKANKNIMLSPTSSALERAKVKNGK